MAIPASAKTLLDFIASYEAPKGYNTVYGNRQASMAVPLTNMSLDAVIADGPRRTRVYGSSACGRFQFMTATLKDLKAAMGLRVCPGSYCFPTELSGHEADGGQEEEGPAFSAFALPILG